MKFVIFSLFICLSLVVVLPEISAAATTKPTRCPTFIGNPKTKTFFKVPARFVCSSKTLKSKALVESEVLTKSTYELQDSFDMAGQGDANTPAFQVSRKPAFITFSVSDPSEKAIFKLSVIEVATKRVVEVLTTAKGSIGNGSTYSHSKGAFYLRIQAESTVRICERGAATTCTDQPVEWQVHLE